MRETSLDDFIGGDDAADEDAPADEEPAADEDAPADEESAADDVDSGGDDDSDSDSDSGAVEPAVSTYDWTPTGADCQACGDAVERRWRDDGRLVCADCKAW